MKNWRWISGGRYQYNGMRGKGSNWTRLRRHKWRSWGSKRRYERWNNKGRPTLRRQSRRRRRAKLMLEHLNPDQERPQSRTAKSNSFQSQLHLQVTKTIASEPGGASATMEALTTCTIAAKQSGDSWAAVSGEATLATAGIEEVAGCEGWTETSGKTAKATPGKRPASRLLRVEWLIARIRNDSQKLQRKWSTKISWKWSESMPRGVLQAPRVTPQVTDTNGRWPLTALARG